jgi:hypothetical protein
MNAESDGMDPPAFFSVEVAGRSLLPRMSLEEDSDERPTDNWD